MCMKERAVEILNDTIMDDNPIRIGFLEIQRNPDYFINTTENDILPREANERSSKLTDIILQKIEQFFKSRTLKLNLSNAFEGKTLLNIYFLFMFTISDSILQLSLNIYN